MKRLVVTFLISGAVLAVAAGTRVAASGQARPTLKLAPVAYTSPTSGADMFRAYCAGCHGADAKGQGTVAFALQSTVPDLTELTAAHQGIFPQFEVLNAIEGHPNLAGRSEMPAWSRIFQSTGDRNEAATRAHVLTDYLESLQKK